MQKQKLFNLSSMPKMVLIITMVVMLGSLFGAVSYLLKAPKIDLPIVNPVVETQCKISSDCYLVYVSDKDYICQPCDKSSEKYQCLTVDEMKKLKNKGNKIDESVLCSPCGPGFDRYVCECANGKCEKIKEGEIEKTEENIVDAEIKNYFDECGEAEKYRKLPWWNSFKSEVEKMNYYSEDVIQRKLKLYRKAFKLSDETSHDEFCEIKPAYDICSFKKLKADTLNGCLALDDSFFVAVSSGENGYVFKYSVKEELLEEAQKISNDMENDWSNWYPFPNFLKETNGSVVYFSGSYGDSHSGRTNFFEYDCSENIIRLAKTCTHCATSGMDNSCLNGFGSCEIFSTDNIDTSDWQTYRNEEFGFEMKYPEDLLAWRQMSKIHLVAVAFSLKNDDIISGENPSNPIFVIYLFSKEAWEETQSWEEEYKAEKVKEDNKGNVVAYKIDDSNYVKEFNQILSTFKFTKN